MADIVYLKDGTLIETPRAWEENGVVKFYLQGTRNIVVSYSADIVDRIVTETGVVQLGKPAGDETVTLQPDEESAQKESPSPANKEDTAVSPSAIASAPKPDDNADLKGGSAPATKGPILSRPDGANMPPNGTKGKYDGIAFYDPRREYKYWSSERSHHRTLKAAIDALAMEFNRSPEWVEQYMGDTNDLGQIYRNLNNPPKQAPDSVTTSQVSTSGILFYNPRRPNKYWVSQTAKFNTFDDALKALAKQYNTTPDWVIANMGDTNDLGEINKNLMESKIRESGGKEMIEEEQAE